MLVYFWLYRLPGVAMVGLSYCFDFCSGLFVLGGLAVARGIQLQIGNSFARDAGVLIPSRPLFWPWLCVIAGFTYVVVVSETPMAVSFHLSRPWLESIADEADADPDSARLLAGRWAGLYQVAGVEVIGRTVVIYIGHDQGNYGFARAPRANTNVIRNIPSNKKHEQHHEDFPAAEGPRDPEGTRLWADWFVMYSYYWFIKVGWS